MDGKLIFLVLCLIYQGSSLKVTVYYESLCPDSIRFITRQLAPTYNLLKFNVEFKPYGKASHRLNPWNINCQHGPNECYGNAVQACALNQITNEKDQLNFVNCVMGSSYPPTSGKECADQLGLNYNGVSACATGDKGKAYLAALGDETHSLTPPLSFVPTIIFNDKFDQTTQDLALRDLARAICSADSTVPGCLEFRKKIQQFV